MRTATYVQLTRETREPRLAVDRGKDMEGELLWPFDDNVVASWIPPNHMVILGFFKQTAGSRDQPRQEKKAAWARTYA